MLDRFVKHKDWSSIWYYFGEQTLLDCADIMKDLGHKEEHRKIKILIPQYKALQIFA